MVGFSPWDEAEVWWQIDLIANSSKEGRKLIDDAEASDRVIFIGPGYGSPYDGLTGYSKPMSFVLYDPDNWRILPGRGEGGSHLITPPAIVLAHELGHAVYDHNDPPVGGKPKPGDNVYEIENKVRAGLGLPLRGEY